MKTRVQYFADRLRTSFWFIPALMVAGAVALAWGTVELDRAMSDAAARPLEWAYTGGPEGARSVLSVVAGSMITVAGVVFSITIVALTLASAQFGPRLLRNFIRDRGNQAVLGAFVATFVYCLLVLRTVRNDGFGNFVPGISVIVGLLLALCSLGVLIYFIHHVAVSIQANQIVASVSEELNAAIGRLFPEELGEGPPCEPAAEADLLPADFDGRAVAVHAAAAGYVLTIDQERLMVAVRERDAVVKLVRRAGHFVVPGDVLALVVPADRADEGLRAAIADAFQLGAERNALQDVEFCVDQLVEVAVRALSPGVNDPFTATICVDRLAEALCLLLRRKIPSPFRHDDDERMRVVAYPVDFADVLDAAFNQIRQYGRGSPAVAIRLLDALQRLADRARRPADRAAIARQALAVRRAADDAVPDELDRRAIIERYERVRAILESADDR